MWDEERVREVAGKQHGLIAARDLASLGVSRRQIGKRLGSCRVEAVHPGVYYVDAVPATWKTTVMAAVLAAGPDAIASHRTAAILWELDAIWGSVVEVTVPYLESPEPANVIVHRTRRVNPSVLVDAIPVTTPERTLFDISPLMSLGVLQKAGRSAVQKSLTTVASLDRSVGRFGGRGVAGTRRMRWLVEEIANDRSGSVSEIDLKHIIEDSPVPRPVQQLRISRPSGGNAYPDFAWPDLMRIIEVDGFVAHGTPEQLQNDLSRQNDLMDLGWEIRRFTATEIRESPLSVREEVVRFVTKPVL